MYRDLSSLGSGTVQVTRVWFIPSQHGLPWVSGTGPGPTMGDPPRGAQSPPHVGQQSPAAPGLLFAGVLPPCLQPLASACLGSCPDGEGGGGRTWKQKGCSGVCSFGIRALLTLAGMEGSASPKVQQVPPEPSSRAHLALPLSPAQGDTMTHELPKAAAPTPSLPKEVPTPPKLEARVLGVLKERVQLPLPTAPGTGVPCPKVGTGAPGKQKVTVSQGWQRRKSLWEPVAPKGGTGCSLEAEAQQSIPQNQPLLLKSLLNAKVTLSG